MTFQKILRFAILGSVVFSFAFFGISGYFFGSAGEQDVARVNGEPIELTTLAQRIDEQRVRFGLTDLAGLPPQLQETLIELALDEVMNEELFDQERRRLGLLPDAEAIRVQVMASESFQNENGQFDREQLQRYLAQTRQTEQQFVERQRRVVGLAMLRTMLSIPPIATPAHQEMLSYQAQQRTFDVAVVPIEPPPVVPPEFDDSQLRAELDDHQSIYQTPQRWRLTALAVRGSALLRQQPVTEEEISAVYERSEARFTIPARRTVEIATFDDIDAARSALIAYRTSALESDRLNDLAGARATNSPTLSFVRTPDPEGGSELQTVALSLATSGENRVSEPVSTPFGEALLRFISDTPSTRRPLDDVREELTDELERERVRIALDDLRIQVEDGLASGDTLVDVARDLGLSTSQAWVNPPPETVDVNPQDDAAVLLDQPDTTRAVRTLQDGDTTQWVSISVDADNQKVRGGDEGVDSVSGLVQVSRIVLPRAMTLTEARGSLRVALDRKHREQRLATRIETMREQSLGQENWEDWSKTLVSIDQEVPEVKVWRVSNVLRDRALQTTPLVTTQSGEVTEGFQAEVFGPESRERLFQISDGEVQIVELGDFSALVRLQEQSRQPPTPEELANFVQQDGAFLTTAVFEAFRKDLLLRADVTVDNTVLEEFVVGAGQARS